MLAIDIFVIDTDDKNNSIFFTGNIGVFPNIGNLVRMDGMITMTGYHQHDLTEN